jgi:nucleotide-binding universal stress UspA family protein
MGNFRTVLVAIDLGGLTPDPDASPDGLVPLGEAAEVTLTLADEIASKHGATLTVLHALPSMYPGSPMSPLSLEQLLVQREDLSSKIIDSILSALERLAHRSTTDASIEIADGPADGAILEGARHLAADLIVVGALQSGRSSRSVLGGTALSVVRHAECSVLVARHPSVGSVVAGHDFTPSGELAASLAADEARSRGVPLTLVHSLDLLTAEMAFADPAVGMGMEMVPGTLPVGAGPDAAVQRAVRARLERRLTTLGVEGDIAVGSGPPAQVISDVAKNKSAALVVVGTSGRTGIDRLLLGSVSANVVREAPCSVLVVRPPNSRPRRASEGTAS